MRDLVHLLGALQFVFGASHLGVASLRTGVGAAQIVAHLRHFERRQQLPLLHAVADIDIDFLDIARHLRHHIDLLKRLELRRQHEIAREIFGRYLGHRDGRNIGRGSSRGLLFGAGNTEHEDQTQDHRGNPLRQHHPPILSGRKVAVYTTEAVYFEVLEVSGGRESRGKEKGPGGSVNPPGW